MNSKLPPLNIYINFIKNNCLNKTLPSVFDILHSKFSFLPKYNCCETVNFNSNNSVSKKRAKYIINNYYKNFGITFSPNDHGKEGKMIEKFIFDIEPNSNNMPDLGDIDIKSTKLRKKAKAGASNENRTSNDNSLPNNQFLWINNYLVKNKLSITTAGSLNNYDSFNNILENSLLENTKYYLKIKKGLLFVLEDQTNILLNVILYDIEELPNEVQKQIQKDYELIRNLIINKNINSQKQMYLQIGRATQKNTFVFSFSPKLISFIINFYS